ncbi:MAG: 2-succinyl-6-hydroxy-2,4-cyclohexadiene-1-carboxylate synthase [Chloroflexi bacterium]|nr:MAG: 2-succinyl-6-hydroxy-2,4-cyclohexadiene-1-carboxylate synthase [Chloroflexota bacterium]
MTRVDLGPLSLNVEIAGNGPPVVLLHGFTGSAAGWGVVIDALSPEYTTVAIDIVGHGRSDSPPTAESYEMCRAVDDLVAVVAKAGHQRATWLGYSMGGRTALQVASFRPEAVNALILEGASPGLPTVDERLARIAADEVLAQRLEREGVEPFVDFWQSISLFASQASLPKAVWDRQRAGRLRNSALGLANSLRGMGTGAQAALHDRLTGITVPALLLAGELDIKYTDAAREMALALPDATMHVIEDAGHAAHLEQPERFNTLVLDFLRRAAQRSEW